MINNASDGPPFLYLAPKDVKALFNCTGQHLSVYNKIMTFELKILYCHLCDIVYPCNPLLCVQDY